MVRPGVQQGDNAAVRRALMSSAYSRHPDLADAPTLDVSLDSLEDVAAAPAAAPRPSQPLVIPVAITPAVERMLQVKSDRNYIQLVLLSAVTIPADVQCAVASLIEHSQCCNNT